jgi:hypothetical protein
VTLRNAAQRAALGVADEAPEIGEKFPPRTEA